MPSLMLAFTSLPTDSLVFSVFDKEYEFKCENTQEFDEKVSKTLQNKESIGKLLNSSIKQQELVAVTK